MRGADLKTNSCCFLRAMMPTKLLATGRFVLTPVICTIGQALAVELPPRLEMLMHIWAPYQVVEDGQIDGPTGRTG